MHSPYSDGQSGHPYPEEVAHTHHAPHVMPTSVEYIQPVKISAYHTNVPYNIQPNPSGSQTSVKRRQWGGEGRGNGGCGEGRGEVGVGVERGGIGVGGDKVREYEEKYEERKERYVEQRSRKDGQSGHPYPEEVAHTHQAPHLMPPSVEYIHTVKISAYHTNVPYNIQPNRVGGGCGEGRVRR